MKKSIAVCSTVPVLALFVPVLVLTILFPCVNGASAVFEPRVSRIGHYEMPNDVFTQYTSSDDVMGSETMLYTYAHRERNIPVLGDHLTVNHSFSLLMFHQRYADCEEALSAAQPVEVKIEVLSPVRGNALLPALAPDEEYRLVCFRRSTNFNGVFHYRNETVIGILVTALPLSGIGPTVNGTTPLSEITISPQTQRTISISTPDVSLLAARSSSIRFFLSSAESCSELTWELGWRKESVTSAASYVITLTHNNASADFLLDPTLPEQRLSLCVWTVSIADNHTWTGSVGTSVILVIPLIQGVPIGTAQVIAVPSAKSVFSLTSLYSAKLSVYISLVVGSDEAACAAATTKYTKVSACGTGGYTFSLPALPAEESNLCMAMIPQSLEANLDPAAAAFQSGLRFTVEDPDLSSNLLDMVVLREPSTEIPRSGILTQYPSIALQHRTTRRLFPTDNANINVQWLAAIELEGPDENITASATSLFVDIVNPRKYEGMKLKNPTVLSEASMVGMNVGAEALVNDELVLQGSKYGFFYQMCFASRDTDSSSMGACSAVIRKQDCVKSTEYGVLFTTSCAPCPEHAVCNGTSTFVVDGSYWRADATSSELFQCGMPYGATPCKSGTLLGECEEGHAGPLCAVCVDGYAGSRGVCAECDPKRPENQAIVALAIIAFVFVIAVLARATLDCSKKDQFPVYCKIFINHLVVASTVSDVVDNLPTQLSAFFRSQQQVSQPSPDFIAFGCVFQTTWHDKENN